MTTDTFAAPPGPDALARFEEEGFLRIDAAFPAGTADAGRAILWRETGCDPENAATWTRPVIRLGGYAHPPFVAAANTARLHAAYDALVGPGRWVAPPGLGTFPVRFPSTEDPGDTGWHVDASFGTGNPDFMEWRVNVRSRGRALLMLFLFSDVGEDDAPSAIRVGSHLGVARTLAPRGEAGMSLRELAAGDWGGTGDAAEVPATGPRGTVYLCHPFLVHGAQPHRGRVPRFMAQPPLMPAPGRDAGDPEADTPVAWAIRRALAG